MAVVGCAARKGGSGCPGRAQRADGGRRAPNGLPREVGGARAPGAAAGAATPAARQAALGTKARAAQVGLTALRCCVRAGESAGRAQARGCRLGHPG